MTGKTKTIVIATAITTLLWATAALANTSSNAVQAPKFSETQSCQTHSSFKNRSDSLVKDRTITMAQAVAIQTAITIANQDATANGDFNCIDNSGSKYVMDSLVKDLNGNYKLELIDSRNLVIKEKIMSLT